MAIPIRLAINGLAARAVPVGTSAEGVAAMSGFMKLLIRYGPGGLPRTKEAALFLSAAEQSALFAGGIRFLLSLGGKIFLGCALLDLARNLIFGGEEKSLQTRFEIIQAHLAKGGSVWARAIGVAEQVCFILLDASGETLGDVAAGVLATWDDPQTIPAELGNFSQRTYYSELLSPADDVDQADAVILAPGFILKPALLDRAASSVDTFPSGPRPSFGRRS
jgi:hypothetical protein